MLSFVAVVYTMATFLQHYFCTNILYIIGYCLMMIELHQLNLIPSYFFSIQSFYYFLYSSLSLIFYFFLPFKFPILFIAFAPICNYLFGSLISLNSFQIFFIFNLMQSCSEEELIGKEGNYYFF